jgi:hypothetical protein
MFVGKKNRENKKSNMCLLREYAPRGVILSFSLNEGIFVEV